MHALKIEKDAEWGKTKWIGQIKGGLVLMHMDGYLYVWI